MNSLNHLKKQGSGDARPHAGFMFSIRWSQLMNVSASHFVGRHVCLSPAAG
ncbi:hypothetical protein CIT292_07677 [Citrobacter youngae ATCC 29220]|uniref:Uncharacterized protein n=1 Tax=Citrobacter youngae ATCC 29220 TaxID=500640 RepID=D4BB30_9ENTR|nr:hypothetical protein CIT292_07677 [Citrobacter youngae ATCC 29220]